ncbi:MAG: hypothetical protein HY540_06040, partial [Deltaproteobacteria bacterium]|nr:hypothetical protein [Deltaproteobacteria bacterium]
YQTWYLQYQRLAQDPKEKVKLDRLMRDFQDASTVSFSETVSRLVVEARDTYSFNLNDLDRGRLAVAIVRAFEQDRALLKKQDSVHVASVKRDRDNVNFAVTLGVQAALTAGKDPLTTWNAEAGAIYMFGDTLADKPPLGAFALFNVIAEKKLSDDLRLGVNGAVFGIYVPDKVTPSGALDAAAADPGYEGADEIGRIDKANLYAAISGDLSENIKGSAKLSVGLDSARFPTPEDIFDGEHVLIVDTNAPATGSRAILFPKASVKLKLGDDTTIVGQLQAGKARGKLATAGVDVSGWSAGAAAFINQKVADGWSVGLGLAYIDAWGDNWANGFDLRSLSIGTSFKTGDWRLAAQVHADLRIAGGDVGREAFGIGADKKFAENITGFLRYAYQRKNNETVYPTGISGLRTSAAIGGGAGGSAEPDPMGEGARTLLRGYNGHEITFGADITLNDIMHFRPYGSLIISEGRLTNAPTDILGLVGAKFELNNPE